MNLLVRTCAIGLIGLSAAAANASITLPGGSQVFFNGGPMEFGTSVLPVPTASGTTLASSSTPIGFSAFGNLTYIQNAANSNDTGSIGVGLTGTQVEQLTFALTNANLQVIGVQNPASSAGLTEKFVIQTVVVPAGTGGPTLSLYDKVSASPSLALNTSSFKGTPVSAGIPAAVNDGGALPAYLDFNNIAGLFTSVELEYKRPSTSTPWDASSVMVLVTQDPSMGQTTSLTSDGTLFPVSGGTAKASFSDGIALSGGLQPGATFQPIYAPSEYVNGYNAELTVQRAIPEPASLAMLAVGGLLIGFRGRNRKQA